MSDDADAYYNAWVSTFSRPDRKLLCSWHVDRSWRRKLNEHLKDKEQMAEVYAALKSLQNDLSETSFRRSLQQFMAWVKGISERLAKYFEKEYARRTREWAACFRVGSRANTNMFVERFHRTLKEVYLEKKQNRRVDPGGAGSPSQNAAHQSSREFLKMETKHFCCRGRSPVLS